MIMKITKIEKKKRLYLLELDEIDKLYITEDTIVHFMLSKGMNISEQELKEIQDYAQFSYGKNLALYYLSFKQRTVKEVRDYLTKYEISLDTIEKVLTILIKDNWLDDAKYAHSFIHFNLLSGDKGAYALKQKLMQKGIAASIIDDELHQHDFTNLAETVAQKLLKKYQGKLPEKALHDKILQQLLKHSHAKAMISPILRAVSKNIYKKCKVYLCFFMKICYNKSDNLINCRKLVDYEASKRRRLYYNSKL